MPGLNKVLLLGRLGRDPESRSSQKGTTIVSFSMACEEEYSSNGEQKKKVEWVNVTAFGKVGEFLIRCGVQKGSLVFVEGKIHTDQWEKDGQKRYSTGVTASIVFPAKLPERRDERAERPAQAGDDEDSIPF